MIFSIIATVFMIAGIALCYFAIDFKIDAAPIGSLMLMAGAAMCLTSVFLYGVSIGTVLGSLVS